MDDYVRESFLDYAEDPSDGMWARIERELPKEKDRPPVIWWWKRYGWLLLAAALVTGLLTRHLQLEKDREAKVQLLERTGRTEPARQGRIQNAQTAGRDENSDTRRPVAPSSAAMRAQTETSRTDLSNPTKSRQHINAYSPAASPVVRDPKNTTAHTSGPAAELPMGAVQPEILPLQIRFAAPFEQLPPVYPILTLPQETPAPSMVEMQVQTTLPEIKKAPGQGGWYAGLFCMPHLLVERQSITLRPRLRPLFANYQQKPQPSLDLSLRIGRKINNRFALESGVGFEQMERNAIHRPRFQYWEGTVISGQGGAQSRSFDYDLNTYGGSAEVSLRTEVSGQTAPSEFERIVAIIATREQIGIVRVPLLAVARFENEHAAVVLKAGPVGNYLAKNRFNITTYQIDNPRLRFRLGDAYSVAYDRPHRWILGYQLAAGMEFKPGRNWRWSLSPSFAGDFPRKDKLRGKLPGHSAFGVSAGLIREF